MSFFALENIRSVTGGEWMQRPDGSAFHQPLVGVGIDTRDDLRERAFLAIKGDRHDGHTFLSAAVEQGARLLIAERPSTLHVPQRVAVLKVDDTRRSLARLATAYRRTFATTRVLAVTGSSGKTTTKRLIHGVLSPWLAGTSAPKSFNNDIGVPLTILAASPRDRFVVVELGTNAPGEISRLAAMAEPDVAVITSIGRSHLEQLGSVEGVAREKSAILSHMREDGLAIVTADSRELRPYLKLAPSVITYGRARDGDLRLTARGRSDNGNWWFEINGRTRFELGLPGEHNAINAVAAVAAGRRMGLTDDRIREALVKVRPDAMRFSAERIGEIDVFNDAYNANPDSVAAALETFAEVAAEAPRRIVLLGDMLELGPAAPALHAEVGKRLVELDRRVRIDLVVTIGLLASHAAAAIATAWSCDRVVSHESLTPAVLSHTIRMLRPGDSVLIKASRGAALERILCAMRAEVQVTPEFASNPQPSLCPPATSCSKA